MPQNAKSGKILVAFFTKTNNTKAVAEQIQAAVGGDLFQVSTKKPYPADYQKTTEIAMAEQRADARPELAATVPVEKMAEYDTIFLGFPIWWGTMPMAMFTFLEQYDLSGKTIVPFCTHGGSGLERAAGDIERLCPNSTVPRGLAVRSGSAGRARQDVADWLGWLNLAR